MKNPLLADLPVLHLVPELLGALQNRAVAVLAAEPGAGKSTAVPLMLLTAPWIGPGKILMLQPRRVAALALASRMAKLLGEELGQTIGYRVSLEAQSGPHTRLEVITEGILTRMVQDDPGLDGVGAVIFDEFHERSAQADLALSFCLDVRANLRPDLRLLVMSATIDTALVAALLDTPPAPVFQGAGALFPVDIHYLPPPSGRSFWQDGRSFCDWLAQELVSIFDRHDGDVLVFLPGRREIERVRQEFNGKAALLVLHGSVPLREQAAVLAPSGTRRIILSTSLAETSLTIPGVRVVVDAGISRFDRFDPGLGMNRLVSERVSRFSAQQRLGRAGRLAAGTCYRLWSPDEMLPQSLPPEIERSDLGSFVLEACAWGHQKPADLRLVSPVSPKLWNQACEVLAELKLLDLGDGLGQGLPLLTPRGRVALGFGTHPRFAALLLDARDGATNKAKPSIASAAILAAWLDEPSLAGPPGSEVATVLGELTKQGHRIDGALGRLAQRAVRHARRIGLTIADWNELRSLYREELLPLLLASALPDRIGLCTSITDTMRVYQLVSGRQAVLKTSKGPRWLVVTEAEAGAEHSIIRAFSSLPESYDTTLTASASRNIEVQWVGLVPKARQVNRFGGLVLGEGPASWQDESTPRVMAAEFFLRLDREGLALLPWDEKSRHLLYRLRFWLANAEADQPPGMALGLDDTTLAATASTWLSPFLRFEPGKPVIDPTRLVEALENIVPWNRKKDFDRLAPDSVTLPSGRRRTLDYGSTGAEQPVLSLHIQEAFGYREHPCAGRVPLLLHLLSPARRPLQITSDLPGFWAGSYQDVRKDMRGRYPRHPWPENPHEVQNPEDL